MNARNIMTTLLVGAAIAAIPTSAKAQYTIDWFAFDMGGGRTSSGNGLELTNLIGQHDAGTALIGGGFTLNGGYFVGSVSAEPAVLCHADAIGPRYLRVQIKPGTQPVALGISSDNCVTKYLDLDPDGDLGDIGFAILTDDPIYRLPADWNQETLYVRGEEIVPGFEYTVFAEVEDQGILSTTYLASTYAHGDVDNNSVANFADILQVVQAFQGLYGGHIGSVDLSPCMPDAIVNFADIQQAVFAFQGQNYEAICPGPCTGSTQTAAHSEPAKTNAANAKLPLKLRPGTRSNGELAVQMWGTIPSDLHAYQLALELQTKDGRAIQPGKLFVDTNHEGFVFSGSDSITAANPDRKEIGALRIDTTDLTGSKNERYLATAVFDLTEEQNRLDLSNPNWLAESAKIRHDSSLALDRSGKNLTVQLNGRKVSNRKEKPGRSN